MLFSICLVANLLCEIIFVVVIIFECTKNETHFKLNLETGGRFQTLSLGLSKHHLEFFQHFQLCVSFTDKV